MDRRVLRCFPRNIQEMYDPQLKRERLAEEQQERVENLLRREVQIVARQFKTEKIVLTPEEESVLYGQYAAQEPLRCMVSILEKAIEAKPENNVIRTTLCRSYDILRGNEPNQARRVMEILRKNQSRRYPDGQ